MEIIKFQKCDKCQGKGQTDGHKCDACFGYKNFYFSNNNFLFWQDSINYAQIFIREFKQTINTIVNTLLVLGSVFTLVLVYIILNKVQFDPRNLWVFINSVDKYNLWLFVMIVLDMYLYYRLTVPGIRCKNKSRLLKSKDTFVKHNIADHLSQEARRIIDRSWLYAHHKKIFPVTVWHVLYILFDDKDIRLVLARLGLGAENLKNKIDKDLSELVKQAEPSKDMTDDVKESLLNAYFHMIDRQGQTIAEVDLFFGLVVASQSVKNFFYDFDIDEQKIDNVIAWIKINNLLKVRYQRFRSKSLFKPKGDVNRAYTAIATPMLDSFSQDFTKMARAGYLPLSVAREKEINEILNTIESGQDSVVLVGDPGVGKGNVVQGLANRMMADEVPLFFQDKRLVSISVPLLISGATGTGKLEERFIAILNERVCPIYRRKGSGSSFEKN